MPKSAAPKPAKRKSPVKALAAESSKPDTKSTRPRGRPPKFETAEEFQAIIESYFDRITYKDDKGLLMYLEPPTMTDIALELGFFDRQSVYDQAGRGEDFSCAVKMAQSRIRTCHEKRLFSATPTGSIFWLKCQDPMFREPASKHLVATKPVDQMTEEELKAFLGD